MRCAIRMCDPWWSECTRQMQCRSAFVPAPASTDAKSSESAAFRCAERPGCVTRDGMSDPLCDARLATQLGLASGTPAVNESGGGEEREVAACKVVRCAEVVHRERCGLRVVTFAASFVPALS